MKVCGVFDGFSHWGLQAMMQFLAYFSNQTGAQHVVIYEAQFIPKSWFIAVGINLGDKKYNLDPGSKRAAPWLPINCTENSDCKKGSECNSEGVCENPCVKLEKTCTNDKDCNTLYKNCPCPPPDPKTGLPTCGYCRTDNHTCHYNMPSDTVESYQDSGQTKWGRFKDNTAPCDTQAGAKKCTSFMMTQMQANATWDPKSTGGYVKSLDKSGVSAICPYGQYYDPDATPSSPFGDCVDWTQKCNTGETSVMGFCDQTTPPPPPKDNPSYSPNPKDCSKNSSCKINVWEGKDTVSLPIPEITLTWYAFSGDVKTANTDTTAKGYTQLILDFCMKAGIKNLAFPFIVPDKNNRPWIINGGDGGPIQPKTTTQVTNAVAWIVHNVLTPAQKNGITIGLNVYASGKDSQWKQWYTGSGTAACDAGDLGCAWEYIGKFINDIDTVAGSIPGIDFIQVDQEWGNYGELPNAVINLKQYSGNSKIKFTMAGSLKNGGNINKSKSIMVPEVYWDAGNQYPCTGGPNTYLYTNRACTTSTTHRIQRNRPKGFYNSIVGDETHYGSDYWDGKAQSNLPLKANPNGPWLNANNFATMQTNVTKNTPAYVYPSFSIENLSMCSEPNKMKLITNGGRQRWVCVGPDGTTEHPPDDTDCASLLYYGSSGCGGGGGNRKQCVYDKECAKKGTDCKSAGVNNACTCTGDYCRTNNTCQNTKLDDTCAKTS